MFDGDECIGVTTSGGFGHYVNKGLGFGYVDLSHCSPGTTFDVVLLGERYQVTVLEVPAHDPDNKRLRA